MKTHAYGDLDERLQAVARHALGDQPAPREMKCLTLLVARIADDRSQPANLDGGRPV